MKKTLFAILVAIVAMMCPGKASAEQFKYTAYKMCMMTYDDDGDEAGWSDWVSTPYYFVLDSDRDIITFKGDHSLKFNIDDMDDWEEVDSGMYCTLYCSTDDGEDTEISFLLSEDGDLFIIVEDDEVKLGFMCEDAGKIRHSSKSKKSSSKKRSKKSSKKRH